MSNRRTQTDPNADWNPDQRGQRDQHKDPAQGREAQQEHAEHLVETDRAPHELHDLKEREKRSGGQKEAPAPVDPDRGGL